MQLKLVTRTKDGILIVDCSGRIVFGEEGELDQAGRGSAASHQAAYGF